LALRNTLDSKKVEPPAVLQATLFGGTPAPLPPSEPKKTHIAVITPHVAPQAPESFNVEVIRGDKKEVSKFPTPAGTPAAASTPAPAAAPSN
jgi:hypothetical protein